MINKKYDCIFSIGEACLCAGILAKLELRNFSSPFDWLYGATLEERIQIFLNDFADYINKEDLEKIGQRDMPEPCDIYYNHRNKITFNHDFPLGGDLNLTYPQIKEKYNHRIKKLLTTIKASKQVLIVYMELPKTAHKISKQTLQEQLNLINNKFPDTQIDMLYIAHNENMSDGESKCEQISPNLFIGECFNRKRKDENDYSGNLKNAKLVLKGISCKKKITEWILFKLKKLIHKTIKIFYTKKLKHGEIYIRLLGIKIKCQNKGK